ncbi:MAG: S8 family serine peptidase [Ignavibacteria bacterium]|nr:S8 family serine peptidase [Ignavibacteria bacterium]
MKKPIFGKNLLEFNLIPEKTRKITGRHFLFFKNRKDCTELHRKIYKTFRIQCSSINEFDIMEFSENNLGDNEVLFYEDLGFALVGIEDETKEKAFLKKFGKNHLIQTEKIIYLPKYQKKMDKMLSENAFEVDFKALDKRISSVTQNLQKINIDTNSKKGTGVKVAILDSGFDFSHKDFIGRNIFKLNNQTDDIDEEGHGTFCTGIACGNIDSSGIRYGIASEADIYISKVILSENCGALCWAINSIRSAINVGCKVISMSFMILSDNLQSDIAAFEKVALEAKTKGAILTAAAGNESNRLYNIISPIGMPANCLSVLAVNGMGYNSTIYNNSNRGTAAIGCEINVVAPGVEIYTSSIGNFTSGPLEGTSFANAHVTGILALLWEEFPNSTPDEIINIMYSRCKEPKSPTEDFGNGLVSII